MHQLIALKGREVEREKVVEMVENNRNIKVNNGNINYYLDC